MAGQRVPREQSAIQERRQAALEEASPSYMARRAEIVRLAAHVFRDKGYEATTLSDVAHLLKTDRASLYYYVGSKEELLQEVVRDALIRDVEKAIAVQSSGLAPTEKIRSLIASMVASFRDNHPHMNVYLEDLNRIARRDSEWAVDIMKRTKQYEALVRSILSEGRETGAMRSDLPIEMVSLALFGMINWMHRWYRPDQWDSHAIAETFGTIFLEGCTPARPRELTVTS